jgi:hypothetical protein
LSSELLEQSIEEEEVYIKNDRGISNACTINFNDIPHSLT